MNKSNIVFIYLIFQSVVLSRSNLDARKIIVYDVCIINNKKIYLYIDDI